MPSAPEELRMFREALRGFVQREIAPHALAWDAAGALPRSLFAALGEQGYLGIRFAEEHGGSGLDFRYTAVLVEELVRCGVIGVPVSVLAHAEFSSGILDRAASP